MGRIKQHFLDQGLTAKDIPLAFACVFTRFPLFFCFRLYLLLLLIYCFLYQTKIQIGKCSHILFSLTLSLSLSLSLSLTDSTRCSPSRSRRPRGLPRTAFNRPRPFANRSRILERLKTTFNQSLLKCWRARADRRERR